jgi:hypothetical protein
VAAAVTLFALSIFLSRGGSLNATDSASSIVLLTKQAPLYPRPRQNVLNLVLESRSHDLPTHALHSFSTCPIFASVAARHAAFNSKCDSSSAILGRYPTARARPNDNNDSTIEVANAAMVAKVLCNVTPRYPPSQVLDNLPRYAG